MLTLQLVNYLSTFSALNKPVLQDFYFELQFYCGNKWVGE